MLWGAHIILFLYLNCVAVSGSLSLLCCNKGWYVIVAFPSRHAHLLFPMHHYLSYMR